VPERPDVDQQGIPTGPQVTTAEVVFLGTGTSVGVPALGCTCDVCRSGHPRNDRTRCAIVIRLETGNLLIDTPPDLRTQLLREDIPLVHSVLYTHEHADHLFGLDDLRLFPFRLGTPVPLYCEPKVEQRIRTSFDYAFRSEKPTHPGAAPQLEFRSITTDPFDVLGVTVTPIPMKHGPRFDVLGFRIGDFAYCTDTNHIPESSLERLAGVDTLVLGALRIRPHPTHFNIEEALGVVDRLCPRRTLLTHISHDLDHDRTCQALPGGIDLAYDGLRIQIDPTGSVG
jgi:phosphoribosyl 1,2-cyclic phosphate phosphodiesterase